MKRTTKKVPSRAQLLTGFGLLIVVVMLLSACHGHGGHGY